MNTSVGYLKRDDTREMVEASLLDEVSDSHLSMWEASWSPAMQSFCAGRPLADRPQDHHWDWRRKAEGLLPLLGYHSFALLCQNELQGLMLINDLKSARLASQFGKPLAYVEFLATAPWNRPEMHQRPRYRGVGTVMVGAVVELSFELGYSGRVGLHALPAAEHFYRDTCKMTELGKDAAHQNLMYFEMTENQAEAFRQRP